MATLKQPKSLYAWLLPKLRRLSMYWPAKNLARERAKVRVEIGTSKQGKPKFRVFYKCAQCERLGKPTLYLKEETQADHILPVIDEETGFTDWNDFMERLFANPEGYQILCREHHQNKTKKENIIRKKVKK